MRITIVFGFFLPVPPVLGGSTEKIWYRLAKEFADAGHSVTLVSRRWGRWPSREIEDATPIRHIRLPGCRHSRFLPINLLLDGLWGALVACNLPPSDIVICNVVSLPIYLRLVRPSVGKVAAVLGRMPKGQNRAYGAVDLLLATSEAVAAKVLAENRSLQSKVFRFANPIDWGLHKESSSQDAAEVVVIGYIGRIHPEKGLELLLDAASLLAKRSDLPNWRLELVGPVAVGEGGGGEQYKSGLLERYQRLLGDRLVFRSPVYDAEELAKYYGRISIFCYPSLAFKGEGLSIAPMEAMAGGAVAVVSKLDCYRDLIKPNVNGFQFDHTLPDANNQLAKILEELMCDRQLRTAVAGVGQLDVQRHDYKESAGALLQEFEKVVKKD